MVEMAFRACATHSLPGEMPLEVVIRDVKGEVVETVTKNM